MSKQRYLYEKKHFVDFVVDESHPDFKAKYNGSALELGAELMEHGKNAWPVVYGWVQIDEINEVNAEVYPFGPVSNIEITLHHE